MKKLSVLAFVVLFAACENQSPQPSGSYSTPAPKEEPREAVPESHAQAYPPDIAAPKPQVHYQTHYSSLEKAIQNPDYLDPELRRAEVAAHLERGEDPNQLDWDGNPLLADAIHYGYRPTDLGLVELLINKGADVNAVGTGGKSALLKAVDEKDMKALEILFNAGINLKTDNGARAMLDASFSGDLQIVRALVDHGAEIDGTASARAPATSKDILGAALNAIADFLAVDTIPGRTPLMNAVRAGGGDKTKRLELIQYLLDHGADVKAVDSTGATVILIAAGGDLDLYQKLYSLGGDQLIDKANIEGKTPVMVATRSQNQDVLNFLISKHANINAKNKAGKTALDMIEDTIAEGNTAPWYLEIRKILVKAGAKKGSKI